MTKQIQIEGSQISYRVIGNGKPVMLIHGFGEDSTVWRNQIEFLKDKYKLIIPDLPGSGKSTKSNLQSAIVNLKWTMESFADDLYSILDAEKITQISLIGHSMGGYITLAFAEKYPDLLSSFGLFHSSAYADNEEKKVVRRKGIDFINEHGAAAFLKTALPNLFAQQTRDERPGLIDEQLAGLNNFSAASLVSYYEAMIARPDRTDLLRKSTVPVLFIMGKYDAAVPVEHSLEQCHLPDNAYIHILRHSAHMGMLEEVEASNMALDKFLL